MAKMSEPMTVTDDMIQIGDNVRLNRGPWRRKATATAELLSNKITANHYRVGARDSLNKPIKIGQEMTYLDWLGEHGWRVYKREPDHGETRRSPEHWDDVVDGVCFVWYEKGMFATLKEAQDFAATL